MLDCVFGFALLPSSFYRVFAIVSWLVCPFSCLFVRPSIGLSAARPSCLSHAPFVVVSRALCSDPPCPVSDHSVLSPVGLASLNHAPPHAPLPPPRPCSRTHHRPRTSPAPARRVSGERASFLKLCVLLNALCSTAPRRKPG